MLKEMGEGEGAGKLFVVQYWFDTVVSEKVIISYVILAISEI